MGGRVQAIALDAAAGRVDLLGRLLGGASGRYDAGGTGSRLVRTSLDEMGPGTDRVEPLRVPYRGHMLVLPPPPAGGAWQLHAASGFEFEARLQGAGEERADAATAAPVQNRDA